MGILYQVNTNLNSGIREVEYIKKTDSFYWSSEQRRDSLNTKYCKSFETKQEAVSYFLYLINSEISHFKSALSYYEEKLEKAKEIYSDFLPK